LAIIGVLTLAGLLVMKKTIGWHGSRFWQPIGKRRWLVVVPLVVTAAALAMIAAAALSRRWWSGMRRHLGIQGKGADSRSPAPDTAYFHDLTLSYSHLDYPLMVPFLTAGAYAAMGTVDDQTGKLVSVFLDVLIVPMVYLGLRWKLRRLPAACLSAILAMLPVMFRYGASDVRTCRWRCFMPAAFLCGPMD